MKPIFWLGCYGCTSIFHGTGNSAQLWQSFRISEWGGGCLNPPKPTLRYATAYGRCDRGFESHREHVCLSAVCVVCCQVELSATSWSLVQRSPSDSGASCVWLRNLVKRGGHSPRWTAEQEIIIIHFYPGTPIKQMTFKHSVSSVYPMVGLWQQKPYMKYTPFSMAQQLQVGQGLLIIEATR
jgi:hypothetical protein